MKILTLEEQLEQTQRKLKLAESIITGQAYRDYRFLVKEVTEGNTNNTNVPDKERAIETRPVT